MKVFTRSYASLMLVCMAVFFIMPLHAQVVDKSFNDSWGKQGFNVTSVKSNGIEVIYSVNQFSINETVEKGQTWHMVSTPGVFLFSDPGQPELPSSGRYIAIPKGAKAHVKILDSRYETYKGIEVMPSNPIPFDTEPDPEVRVKDLAVYEKDAFFPSQAVSLSEVQQIRGMDVVMLGVSPFQYNPVSKELKVLRDLKIEVSFDGGKGFYAEDKYRSLWWDQILDDVIINLSQLPKPDYKSRYKNMKDDSGYEYLIIVPDHPDFLAWADTIKEFRTKQGIYTGIKTITEVGGNTVAAITNYINNAYNNWEIPPVAVLLMADYSAPGTTTGITAPSFSHPYSGTYITDNRYADMTGNLLPDIAFARITGNDAAQLQVMVKKFIDYETNPPTSPSFYNNPITALGWQTERWFQICSEAVGGFWKNQLDKNPIRINAIYSGTPGSVWSTATNTAAVVNYFGPGVGGRGYIPATPAELGGWSGGVAANITAALNNGSFMLQHRDHGFEQGWGEPDYNNNNINSLINTDLSFIMSINCLTGRFDHSSESFAEKFHRHTYNGQGAGALGLIAASQVSYSFVNDAFVWGMMDNMWPEFMPDYGNHTINRKLMPAFGNVAGKYFLQQSSWPYNTDSKAITYDLFHHHGDAFLKVYSEVPQTMIVNSPDVIVFGQNSLTVQAYDEVFVAISYYDEQAGESRLLAAGISDGTDLELELAELAPVGSTLLLTATKQNYYRFTKEILVIPPDGSFVIRSGYSIDDSMGNGNGLADYGESFYIDLVLENVGNESAENVKVTLECQDPYVISLTESVHIEYGDIEPGQTVSSSQSFLVQLATNTPNQHRLGFQISIVDDSQDGFNSTLFFRVNAPVYKVNQVIVDDSETGDNNGRIDPGETAKLIFKVQNTGAALADEPFVHLAGDSPYLSIENESFIAPQMDANQTVDVVFNVTAHDVTVNGTPMPLTLTVEQGHQLTSAYDLIVGQIPVVTIGEGNVASNQYPFYNYYKANRSQMLFKGEEFGSGESILNAISFSFSTISPEAFRNLPNFVIRIKPTTLQVLTGAFFDMSGADTLVYGNPYTLADNPGWFEMPVNTFTIDASQNYVIDIAWGQLPNWTSTFYKVNCTTYPEHRVVFGYSDNAVFPNYPGYNGSSANRPNMKFHFLAQQGGMERVVLIGANNQVTENPIEGVSVKIGTKSLQTDTQGKVQIQLIEGSYQASITHNDFHALPEPLAIEVAEANPEINVFMVPYYRVNFNVVDVNGNPIPDAIVKIAGVDYPAGQYFFGDLAAGTYVFVVGKQAYFNTQGEFTLYDVHDINIDVELLIDNTFIEDNELTQARIFPNPTSGGFTLYLGEKHSWKEVQLLNNLGQSLKTIVLDTNQPSGQLEFTLQNLPKGLYMVRMISGENTSILKVVKQ